MRHYTKIPTFSKRDSTALFFKERYLSGSYQQLTTRRLSGLVHPCPLEKEAQVNTSLAESLHKASHLDFFYIPEYPHSATYTLLSVTYYAGVIRRLLVYQAFIDPPDLCFVSGS